jgi:hypothetical protein
MEDKPSPAKPPISEKTGERESETFMVHVS